jgi:energy-coupling factor transporter transmembrane protein EcfT
MSKKITPLQGRDTCLALTFLLLLIWFFTRNAYLVYAAMLFLLVGMAVPVAMKPLAWVWFGFSHLLGQFMSRVLLSIVYLLFVLPMGLVRRVLGKDSLRLKLWKQGDASCFVERGHVFTADDLKNPY